MDNTSVTPDANHSKSSRCKHKRYSNQYKCLKKKRLMLSSPGNSSTNSADSMSSPSEEKELQLEIMKLQESLAERVETVRKLTMVKTYRSKNNLEELEVLIAKWRLACQEAIMALASSTFDTNEKPLTAKSILDQLKIDYGLVKYNTDDESFY